MLDLKHVLGKKFFVCAGIGSFAGFMESLKKIGVEIFDFKEYPDHYNYTLDDVLFCVKCVQKHGLQGVITTQKDWVKILPLIQEVQGWRDLPIYVAHVDLAFLYEERKVYFLEKLGETLGLR
jgi:tetraacyldisaccharide-1-P 4'-kinase